MTNNLPHNEESHLLDHRHHDATHKHLDEDVPLYAPPQQRQRWGDHQMLPHVNWGDLFFDLFYVAAAHNLARILEVDPSSEGLLYFCCCYIAVFQVWTDKILYSSRYAVDDNFAHRLWEVVQLCVLGTLVQNIRSARVMSHPAMHPNTMIFAACVLLDTALEMLRQVDVIVNVVGGPEAKLNGRADRNVKIVPLLIYLASAVWAGYDYYFVNSSAPNHFPVVLVVIGVVSEQMMRPYLAVTMMKRGVPFNECRVPSNLEFVTHRLGEWMMLMLGESILSLLIVAESWGNRYFVTFYTGILSVTLLQYVFFRSQPKAVDDHAFRRNSNAGILFYISLSIFSASLIVFGGSYKLILVQYLDEQQVANKSHTVVGRAFTLAQRQGRIANMFSWSLAVSFLSLDIMTLTHRGLDANLARYWDKEGKLDRLRVLVSCVNLALLIFSATLSLWAKRLEVLSVLGLVVVVAQIFLRTLRMKLFPISKEAHE